MLLSRALAERGAETHLVFQNEPTSEEFQRDVAGRIHVVPAARHPADRSYIRRISRLLRDVEATHLHVHHGTDAYLGLVAARLSGVERRFATRHNTPSLRRRFARTLPYRWQAGQVEAVFAVSEMVRSRLLQLGMPAAKVTTHYLGVDPGRYAFTEQQRSEARARRGIDSSARVLVSTSHLRELKGTEILPDLASR